MRWTARSDRRSARPLRAVFCYGVLGFLAASSPLAAQRAAVPRPGPAARFGLWTVVFRGVTVVDVADGRLLPEQTVVVVGTRVHAVGPVRRIRVPRGAKLVDARGKYLIPGLWNMHVHLVSETPASYAPHIAYGVTGIRDMGTGHLDSVLRWRREFAAGTRIGPRVVTPGPILAYGREVGHNDNGGHRLGVGVLTPDDARRVVDSLKSAGADFIKVRDDYSESGNMPREVYFAVAAEARRLGMPFAGHPPRYVTMAEASDSGQRSLEHYNAFFGPCWRSDSAGERECAALAAQFTRNGTWLTPTLLAYNIMGVERKPNEPGWYLRPDYTPDTASSYHGKLFDNLETGLWFVRTSGRVGMPLLAGTDAIAPGTDRDTRVASRLHDELALFVEAGLTPAEALRTATLNPAKYFGATDSLGTVAPGKLADLVLLDANPLADIHNTTKIRAVVANGHYFDRGTLDSLLAGPARPAGQAP